MDRIEIQQLLTAGAIDVYMNDGTKHTVARENQPTCSDIALSFLRKSKEDNKWRHAYLPLVTMTRVEVAPPTN